MVIQGVNLAIVNVLGLEAVSLLNLAGMVLLMAVNLVIEILEVVQRPMVIQEVNLVIVNVLDLEAVSPLNLAGMVLLMAVNLVMKALTMASLIIVTANAALRLLLSAGIVSWNQVNNAMMVIRPQETDVLALAVMNFAEMESFKQL